MITSLTTNARAKQRDLKFDKPIVVITGPNQSGKTTILDSITLALIGHIPRLGKTNEKLSSLIGWSGAMDIQAEINGEKRKFRLSGNEVDGYKKTADKTPLCSAAFDAKLFLNSGPTARIEIIQRALGSTVGDPVYTSTIRAAVQKVIAEAGGQFVLSKAKPSLNDSLDLWWNEVVGQFKMSSDMVDRYSASALTDMETSDSPPEYSKEGHDAEHQKYIGLSKEQESIDRAIASCEIEIQKAQAVLDAFQFSDESEIVRLQASLEEKRRQAIENAAKMSEVQVHGDGIKSCPTCGQSMHHTVTQCDEWHNLDAKSVEIDGAIAELEDEIKLMKPPAIKAEKETIIKENSSEKIRLESLKADIGDKLDQVAASCDQYKEQADVLRAWDEKQKLNSQVQRSREQAEINLNSMRLAKAELDKLYNESTEKVLGPVMSVANQLLEGILPHPLTHRGFNLGYWTAEKTWVPIEGFCGAEEAAATIAFTAALASTENLKIAILDEVGNLDTNTLGTFCINLEKAVRSKILDQVFLAGVRIDPEESELIQVVCL